MPFPDKSATELLVECHRRCCICHCFCGVKMELDHIVPKAQGGKDTKDNAIPVCFGCHAEIHAYNDSHPRGRKFRPDELREHKEQWLKTCREHPEALLLPSRVNEVGPLQALIDELTVNLEIAGRGDVDKLGCCFHDRQFNRAIETGSIALLKEEIRNALIKAYVTIGSANNFIRSAPGLPHKDFLARLTSAQRHMAEALPQIRSAIEELMRFLASDAA